MIHFKIDSYFTEICSTNKGYYYKVEKILKYHPKKNDFKNTLLCLSFIRNSFHNNGIHLMNKNKWQNNEEPQEGEIDRIFKANDFTIYFKHNETIVYTMNSIYLLIYESVKILEQIIYEHLEKNN